MRTTTFINSSNYSLFIYLQNNSNIAHTIRRILDSNTNFGVFDRINTNQMHTWPFYNRTWR
uniref:Uncharacterized protein n=1 Tax=Meloidogyne enterolobii TaxID=390850 RepID=A0A6V7Y4A1_MELEN|nr:unnamed protein product [Meloidogyne enterolobii]